MDTCLSSGCQVMPLHCLEYCVRTHVAIVGLVLDFVRIHIKIVDASAAKALPSFGSYEDFRG